MGRGILSLIVVLCVSVSPLGQGVDLGCGGSTLEGPVDDGIFTVPEVAPSPERVASYLSNIDGFFTENKGQLDPSIRYYCLGSPLSVAFGDGWVAYDYRPDGSKKGMMFHVRFDGATGASSIGASELPHRSNFFIGNDPEGWHTGIRHFREVLYPSVWDGIDLRFSIMDGAFKYELVVAPGGDPARIRLCHESVDHLSVDGRTGDLLIWTDVGTLRDKAPFTYQEGPRSPVQIGSSYTLMDDGSTVGFQVGEYDDTWPLVIDPELEYCTFLGGSGGDGYGFSEVDDSDNLYLTGSADTNFPVTQGSYDTSYGGRGDVFVSKMDFLGSSMVWSTYIGGASVDTPFSLSVDASSDLFIAGETRSQDFPTTTGAYQTTYGGGNCDAFILKLNSTGDVLVYSTYLGGIEIEQLWDLDIDSQGDAYVTGRSYGDYPTTNGCFCSTLGSDDVDIFVSKLDADGSNLVYSTYFPGFTGWTIQVDEDGCAYVGGSTFEDSPTTPSAYQSKLIGVEDCVVFKLNAQGTALLKSTMIGGGGDDDIRDLVLDEQENVLMIGFTFNNISSTENNFPTTVGAYDRTYGKGGFDNIIVKLNSSFESLDYSTYFGGRDLDGNVLTSHIALGENGSLLFTIATLSDDIETTESAYDQSHNGGNDVFIGRMDANGTALEYGSYFGSSGHDEPYGIHNVRNGTVITGSTSSAAFPATDDAFQKILGGSYDCFIAVMGAAAEIPFDAKVPSEPQNLTITPGDGLISLSWTPPSDLGNLTLKGYRVYRKGPFDTDLTFRTNLSSHDGNFTDTDVTNGQEYSYAVSAFNFLGEGDRSSTVNATPLGTPSMPLNLRATPGCGTVALGWDAPSRDGGTSVLGYRVYRGTVPINPPHLTDLGNVTGYSDGAGLENGQKYYYRVLAFNAIGNGSISDSVTATPVGPPDAPWDLKATPGDTTVALSWRAPIKNGGAIVLGYRILRGDTETSLVEHATRESYETSFQDVELENGRTYHYVVIAFNSIGNGTRSAVVTATPVGLPGIPRNLVVEPGDGHVVLSWTAPDDDGGTPVLGYRIYRGTSENAQLLLLEVDTITHTDSGLTNGLPYYYRISAINAVGEGAFTGSRMATPLGLPGPPGDVVAEAGFGTVALSWSSPAETGGSALTGYVLYRGEGPSSMVRLRTLEPSLTSYMDTGLTAGTNYHYALSAITVAGEGLMSATVNATPYGPPSAPRDLLAAAGAGEVALTWTAPKSDGGSPLDGYVVLRGSSEAGLQVLEMLANVHSYKDRAVQNGATYYYAVAATNAAGQGETSSVVNATPFKPATVPGKIRTLTGEAKGDAVTIVWTAPEDDGDSAVIGYVILRGESPSSMSVVAELGLVTSYTDSGLARGRTFYYSVAAKNAIGQGEPFAAVEVKVPKKPSDGPGFDTALALVAIAAVLVIMTRSRRQPRIRQ